MDPEFIKRFEEMERKLDAIYKSTEKVRKYLFWTFVAGIVTFVIPLIILMFVLPFYISSLSSGLNF